VISDLCVHLAGDYILVISDLCVHLAGDYKLVISNLCVHLAGDSACTFRRHRACECCWELQAVANQLTSTTLLHACCLSPHQAAPTQLLPNSHQLHGCVLNMASAPLGHRQ
jgi:hypothetical protein